MKFNEFLKNEELSENFANKLRTSARKAMKNVKKKSQTLKAGQSGFISIPFPKDLSEASKQVGKKGGEVAEFQFLLSLYDELEKLGARSYLKYNGKSMSRDQFENGPYEKNIKEYIKQEKGTKKNALHKWKAHGTKGAQHVAKEFVNSIDPLVLYDFTLEATGVELTGKEKSDVKIYYKKKEAFYLEKFLKLSLKTSEEASPFADGGYHVGFQTSYKHFILSFLTGLGANDLKKSEMTELQVERAVTNAQNKLKTAIEKCDKAEANYKEVEKVFDRANKEYLSFTAKLKKTKSLSETPKRLKRIKELETTIQKMEKNFFKERGGLEKKYNNAHQMYSDAIAEYNVAVDALKEAGNLHKLTVDYKIDQLGKGMRMRTTLSQNLDNLISAFEQYQKDSRGKSDAEKKKLLEPLKPKRAEYLAIIKKVLEKKMKDPKQKQMVIDSIMKFSGIETKGGALDYLNLGATKVVSQKSSKAKTYKTIKGFPDFKRMPREEKSYLISQAASTLYNSGYHDLLKKIRTEDLDVKMSLVDEELLFEIYRSSMPKTPFLKISAWPHVNNARVSLPKIDIEGNGDFSSLIKVFGKETYGDAEDLAKKLKTAELEVRVRKEKDEKELAAIKKKYKEQKKQGK